MDVKDIWRGHRPYCRSMPALPWRIFIHIPRCAGYSFAHCMDAIFIISRQRHLTKLYMIFDCRERRVAALVGALLAVSGAIMQGMTRNPLAEPSIMGVTSGSAFAVSIAFVFFPGFLQWGLCYGPLRERGWGHRR